MQEAIQRLVSDKVFNDTQTLLANTSSIESAEKQLRVIEEEISTISQMIQGSPFKVTSGSGATNGAVLPPPKESHKDKNDGGILLLLQLGR